MLRLAALLLPALVSAEEVHSLDDALAPLVERFDVPALGVAVIESGELVARGVAGVRVRGGDTAVTADDLWHLGSCTKAMTATLVARLVDRGELSFEAALPELFPHLADEMHAAWRDVTMLDLLQHRAGLAANPEPPLWTTLTDLTATVVEKRARLVREMLLAPPAHEPGEFLYSNTGYILAGAATELACERSWEESLRALVFEPLGMTSAGFGAPGTAAKDGAEPDQPRGHADPFGTGRAVPVEPGPRADNPDWLGPAGTVHATLADWGKFLTAHLAGARGEESELLLPGTFERLHLPPEGSGTYACGWIVEPRAWANGDVLIHSGSNTMWYAVVFVAPNVDRAVFAVCNAAGAQAPRAVDAAVQIASAALAVQSEKR